MIHLMPVCCWMVIFFIVQSMAKVKRKIEMTHPCRTADLTVNLMVKFPTLQEKFLQKI